ncbi:MAG: ABC transporter permease [Tissierellia bacterium]|nr:ABC transporter permease [Tissierellia bacterium]
MFRESIIMSWKNIIHNKMRSFLTILGIVIGVAAIIALITIVQGVIDNVDEQFDKLGANTLIIQASGTPLKSGLNDYDIEALKNIEGITGIGPNVSLNMDIWYNGVIYENINIQGRNDIYFNKFADRIRSGRGINVLDVENKNNVCVISSDFEQKLFPGENGVNKTISIGGIEYVIVGVLGNDDNVVSVTTMMSADDEDIMIPYKNLMNISGMKNIVSLELYTREDANKEIVTQTVKTVLNAAFNYKDDSYILIEMDSLLDVMKTTQQMMKGMLVGIASISLVVGGIGIMNMMLVSVTERTTEIGLRKALGAQPRSIQLQFMIEAIFLSVLGGFVGIVIGGLISYIASNAIGIKLALEPSAVLLGFGFSAAVGIIFGSAPARKASKLNPIDALRSV